MNAIIISYNYKERAYEIDEEDIIIARVKDFKILQLLQRLRLYEEQQEDGDDVFISRLNRFERNIIIRKASARKQASIQAYFSSN